MPELRRAYPGTDSEEKVFFCHIPRTGGSSIIKMMQRSGWSVSYDILGNEELYPTSFQIMAHYREKGEPLPRSYAITRHPMRRLESAFRVMRPSISNKQLLHCFREMSIETIYATWNRLLRPAHDLILDRTSILQYESGFNEVVHKLIRENLIDPKVKTPHLKRNTSKKRISWEKVSQETLQKVRSVYAQDFYHFQYLLFPDK